MTLTLSPVEVASSVTAVALAATRLLTIAQPLWKKLPTWLAVALPVLVMDLPQIASAFGVVQTNSDLVNALLASLALLVPGLAAATEGPAAPPAA